MANEGERFCFAWYEATPRAGQDRAALWEHAKWPPGAPIYVGFLDGHGSEALRRRVFDVAKTWTGPGMANLDLRRLDRVSDCDVRIAFMAAKGSWSTIGTTCRLRPKDQPTMNYGWLTDASSDEEVRAVVLHEFGHALGLIHEHQNPAGGIHWNKPAIYAELSGPPNNWSKETIDANMFAPWDAAETNFTAVDPTSIMMYPIPARWTTDGFTAGYNTSLSRTDKDFIAAQYH